MKKLYELDILGSFNKHKFADFANLIAVRDIRFLYIIFFINQKNSLTELIGFFSTEEWSAFANANESLNSVGKLKVLNSTHLYWGQYNLLTKRVIDSVMVIQDNHGPFKQQTLSNEINEKIVKVKEKEKQIINNNNNQGKPSTTEHDEKSDKTGSTREPTGTGQKIREMLEHVDKRIAIGVGSGVGALVLLIIIIVVVKKKRASKTKKYRRWDDKVDYGRKFYSSYNHVDTGDKEADDFEVDVSDGHSAASKLLTDDRK